jgi:hypothetical protein
MRHKRSCRPARTSARSAALRARCHHRSATLRNRWRPPAKPAARSCRAGRRLQRHLRTVWGLRGRLPAREAERLGMGLAVVLGHRNQVAGLCGRMVAACLRSPPAGAADDRPPRSVRRQESMARPWRRAGAESGADQLGARQRLHRAPHQQRGAERADPAPERPLRLSAGNRPYLPSRAYLRLLSSRSRRRLVARSAMSHRVPLALVGSSHAWFCSVVCRTCSALAAARPCSSISSRGSWTSPKGRLRGQPPGDTCGHR